MARGVAYSLLLLAACLLSALISRASVAVPFQDELLFHSLYSALAAGHLPSWAHLFAAYNGHPYLLLNLAISATILWGLPWYWMMYAQVMLLLTTSFLVLRRFGEVKTSCWWPFALGVTVVVLSPRQWENLYWGMQVVFPLFLLSSAGAFVAVDAYAKSKRPAAVLAAMLVATIASLCNGAGILTLYVAAAALFMLKPSRFHAALIVGFLGLGTVAFMVSQSLAQTVVTSRVPLELSTLFRYWAAMLQHAFGFGRQGSGLWFIGPLAAFGTLAYSSAVGLRNWRSNLIGLLFLALGIGISLVITYSRVRAGTYQPDAPRYLTLLIPIPLGCLCILFCERKRLALWVLALALTIPWGVSAMDEWAITPYRRINLLALQEDLCKRGITPDEFRVAKPDELMDIQTLFCDGTGSPYQWDWTPLAQGSRSIGESAILPERQWQSSDQPGSSQNGMRVYTSNTLAGAATGSISLRIRRGDRVFYRSGSAGGHQLVRLSGSALRPALLPVATDWALLEFSAPALPDGWFVATFSDEGSGPGEWSSIAVTRSEKQ